MNNSEKDFRMVLDNMVEIYDEMELLPGVTLTAEDREKTDALFPWDYDVRFISDELVDTLIEALTALFKKHNVPF